MKGKKFLLPILLVPPVIALTRRAFTKSSSEASTVDSTTYDKIDAYIEEQMQRLNIPGASLAIVEGKQIVHQRGFGSARPDGEAPTSQTPFFIGSLTKSFTALAVMQLVEAGKIELNAPVQHYLPWFRVADPQVSAQITIRHLLNQTSSLPVVPGQVGLTDFDNRPGATERQVRALSTLKTTRPVGVKFEYSNLNYNILGLVVEAASGESFEAYIQNYILNPLEMNHTYTDRSTAQRDGLAMGYRHWFSLPFPSPDLPVPKGSLPSGQLISCAEDMSHYLITHLNGGHYGNAQILSTAGIAELHHGVAEVTVGDLDLGKYGMGWYERDLGQIKIFTHAGNVPDFSAIMSLIPEQKKGLILIFNADPYGLPPITDEVGMGVTALLAGQEPSPNRLDFVQWIMRLLPLIPILQALGVFATLRFLRRWYQEPASRSSGKDFWGRHILLPLLPNLILAAVFSYLRSSGLLRFLHFYMPDLSWILRISGGFAGTWASLCTGLIFQTLRKSCKSNTLMEETIL